MTRFTRTLLIASVLVLPLGGCATYDTINDAIDPSEWFAGDFFGLGAKKKLPGDRKAVFPEGVPGVARGVPPDLVKGNQAAGEAALEQQAAIMQEQEPKPAPKPKAKAKPRPKAETAAVERAPTSITVRRPPEAQQEQQQGGQWPDPPGARTAQPAQRPTPAAGGVLWPDPPPTR